MEARRSVTVYRPEQADESIVAARTLLDKKLIRHTRWLHDASDLRQGSDYVAEYHVSGEEAEKTLKNAELFLDEVKKVL